MTEVAREIASLPPMRLLDALRVQMNVIGALIMREIHTRYGRDNIGYLWVFAEPMTLAVAVAIIHAKTNPGSRESVSVVGLTICGYLIFCQFRAIVGRAEAVLDGNRPLLYHRMVTILDMLIARAILEAAAVGVAYVPLMGGAVALGLADLPARPIALIGGLFMGVWFSFALSLIVCAATHYSSVVTRFLHPAIYFSLPLSGAFVLIKWLPPKVAAIFQWIPLDQIEELVRYGQFEQLDTKYVHFDLLLFVCMALTFIGLLCIKILRPHIHLE